MFACQLATLATAGSRGPQDAGETVAATRYPSRRPRPSWRLRPPRNRHPGAARPVGSSSTDGRRRLLLGRMQGKAQRPRSEAAAGSHRAADAWAGLRERLASRPAGSAKAALGNLTLRVMHGKHRQGITQQADSIAIGLAVGTPGRRREIKDTDVHGDRRQRAERRLRLLETLSRLDHAMACPGPAPSTSSASAACSAHSGRSAGRSRCRCDGSRRRSGGRRVA